MRPRRSSPWSRWSTWRCGRSAGRASGRPGRAGPAAHRRARRRAASALTAAVTAACLVLGTLAAGWWSRTDLPGGGVLAVLLALPLAVPSYVAGFAWISERPESPASGARSRVLTAGELPVRLPAGGRRAARDRRRPWRRWRASLGHGPAGSCSGSRCAQVRPAAAAGGLLVALYVLSRLRRGVAHALRHVHPAASTPATAATSTAPRPPCSACVLVRARRRWSPRESALARGRAAPGSAPGRRPPRGARAAGPARRPLWLRAALAVVGVALGVPAVSLTHWMLVGSSHPGRPGRARRGRGGHAAGRPRGHALTIALALPVGVLAARHRGRLTATARDRPPTPGTRCPASRSGWPWCSSAIRLLPASTRRSRCWCSATPCCSCRSRSVPCAPPSRPPRRGLEERGPLARARPARDVLRRVTLPLAAPGVAAGAALVFLTCCQGAAGHAAAAPHRH